MRVLAIPFLIAASLLWGIYEWVFNKNEKLGKEIISITLFCGAVWALIFYWIFS